MTEPRSREIDTILDRRRFDATVDELRDTLTAIQAANDFQHDAIDALRSANQAALRMLRESNGTN